MKHPLIISSCGKVVKKTDKQSIVARYLSTPAGRAALASAMIQPIRGSLGYQGLARRVFQVQQLPQGALPTYDKDIDVGGIATSCSEGELPQPPACFKHNKLIINSNGKPGKASTLNGFNARRVIFPTFEIVNSPSIRISDVKKRRSGVIDRAVQKARRQIMAREDEEIFKALDSCTESGNK
jgi:hypothetical protein